MNTLAVLAAFAAIVSGPAAAAGLADGARIGTAIAGNTVQGSMLSTGVYTEFYAEDGQIRGAGYQGAWSVRDDTMCFDYGSDPENCWQVRLEGDQVTWVQDGRDLGTGTIVAGNVNDF